MPIEFADDKVSRVRDLAAVRNCMGKRGEDGLCFFFIALRQRVMVAVALHGIFI